MPKKLPPRNKLGRFTTEPPSDQPVSTPERTREPEASTSSSTSRDLSIESPSPAAVSHSPLAFPPPVRHSIPGAFSPLTDSPSESPNKSPIPVSTLVARQASFLSSSSVPFREFRTPSPISLPESVVSPDFSTSFGPVAPDPDPDFTFHPDPNPDPVSVPSSPSSSTSSRTVSFAPRQSSQVFSVNFRASRFLSSHPDPPSNLSPALFSSVSSSADSSVSLQSLAPSSNQAQQPLLPSSTALPSSTLALTPVVPTPPTTVSASTQTAPTPPTTAAQFPLVPVPPPTASALPTVPVPPPTALAPPTLPAPPPAVPAPPPAPPAHLPAPPIVPAIVPAMAANPPTGPATMPYPKDSKAPYFSGRPGDPLDSFLREFEELANQSALNPQQKLETILRYIPLTLQDLWKILDGYSANDWPVF